MLSMLVEETRVTESDLVGTSEEVHVGEVMFPESNTRRWKLLRE